MKLTCIIVINVKKKMTQGQGHKIEGQGQTQSYEKNAVLRINHQAMTGS